MATHPFESASHPRLAGGRAGSPRKSHIPPARRWFRGEIAPLVQIMLNRKVWADLDYDMFGREADPRKGERPPMVGEVEQAEREANKWAGKWFLPADADAWLTLHPWIGADLAADLQRNGIGPADAAMLVRNGIVSGPDSRGLNLAKQINIGDLSVEAAKQLLRNAQKGGPQ